MQAYLSLFDCRFAGLRDDLHGELFYPIRNDEQIFDLLLNVWHLQSWIESIFVGDNFDVKCQPLGPCLAISNNFRKL